TIINLKFPDPGDSIWIRAAKDIPENANVPIEQIAQGAVEDKLNLYYKQRATAPILLVVKPYRFRVLHAYYLDTDERPDGYIDEIRVVIDQNVKVVDSMIPALIKNVVLPDKRKFLPISTADGVVWDKGFSIKVRQDKGQFGSPVTAVDPATDVFKLSLTELSVGVFITEAQMPIADSLAPVLTKAVFCPKFITDENVDVHDTLELMFSEDVKVPRSMSPYQFHNDRRDILYSMNVTFMRQYNDAHYLYSVDTIINLKFPDPGDSIWIRAAKDIPENANVPLEQIAQGAVEDKLNLYYKQRATAPILLVVKPYNCLLKVIVSGPSTIIPPEVKQNLHLKSSQEIVTLIQPIGTTRIGNFALLSFKQDIIDPLGNLVRTDMESRWEETVGVFVIEWDLTNRKRYVGSGAYLFLVRHYYDNKYTGRTDRIMVGFHKNFHD
ncbi:MAG: hypothetical protein JW795_04970, partial [Chitinivibrionales bacterium]|nr:hypothetical protein [Chitinivibrionales bacterium]